MAYYQPLINSPTMLSPTLSTLSSNPDYFPPSPHHNHQKQRQDLDLTLPHSAPELGARKKTFWDNTAFALYTLTPLPPSRLQGIASALEAQWISVPGGQDEHLVRIATCYNFAAVPNAGLKDIVEAHIVLNRETKARVDGMPGGLKWFPTAFLVLVEEEGWEAGGLLFVFADEGRGFEMGLFDSGMEEAGKVLAGIATGDLGVGEAKELVRGMRNVMAEK